MPYRTASTTGAGLGAVLDLIFDSPVWVDVEYLDDWPVGESQPETWAFGDILRTLPPIPLHSVSPFTPAIVRGLSPLVECQCAVFWCV